MHPATFPTHATRGKHNVVVWRSQFHEIMHLTAVLRMMFPYIYIYIYWVLISRIYHRDIFLWSTLCQQNAVYMLFVFFFFFFSFFLFFFCFVFIDIVKSRSPFKGMTMSCWKSRSSIFTDGHVPHCEGDII